MKTLILPLALLVATTLSAEIVRKSMPYEHDGVKLEGYLVYDDEKTKEGLQPGVIVVHEWWGRNEFVNRQAEKLAQEGYVAFALDMYGAGIETRDANEAREHAGKFYGSSLMAERAQAGLDAFLSTGFVDADKVAAVGYCFGGSVVQELAYSGAPLAGIVSVHGGVSSATPESAARNQAKFLICHGAADPFVHGEVLDRFLFSLEENNVDYQFILYQGAKHAFSNEEADEYAELNKLDGVKYHPQAAERSWKHTKVFLKEVLKAKRG